MIFKKINEWIRMWEASVINLLSAIAPWLAPLAPAYMTYQNCRGVFEFPEWLAVALAVLAEILGLASINTALTFWAHNRKYTLDKHKVPLWIPITAFVFYLMVIGTMNVVLEIWPGDRGVLILARALLLAMVIPAGVLIAVRAAHTEIIEGLRRPATQSTTQHEGEERRPARGKAQACLACGKRFNNQQGLAAHFKHLPAHRAPHFAAHEARVRVSSTGNGQSELAGEGAPDGGKHGER